MFHHVSSESLIPSRAPSSKPNTRQRQVLRCVWFPLLPRPQVEVSPLENAIYVVENKNHELRTLISQYQHKQLHGNINLLSMCLNGVIDAAVNGGIARYQEVRRARGGLWDTGAGRCFTESLK